MYIQEAFTMTAARAHPETLSSGRATRRVRPRCRDFFGRTSLYCRAPETPVLEDPIVPHLPRAARWLLLVCLLLLVPASPIMAAKNAPRINGPEYGLSAFLYDQPATTGRDLSRVQALGFGWTKLLFRWIDLEPGYKGDFFWTESDRVVQAANAAGMKVIARLDFEPGWARAKWVR